MTLPIYWQNPKETGPFEVKIVSFDNGWVQLDQEVLYPEGGGQPSDQGLIIKGTNRWQVKHVKEKSGNIWLKLDKTDGLHVGDIVQVVADSKRRRILMQMHSGQHLFSAVLENEFGIGTTRVQMDVTESEISTDMKMSEEQIDKAEKIVNGIILGNVPIKSLFLTKDEVTSLKLRGNIEGISPKNGKYRLVQIGRDGTIDKNLCGGTHLDSTIEIQAFIVTQIDGKRIKFKCGEPAIEYAISLSQITRKLKNMLSVGHERFIEIIEKTKNENRKLRKQVEHFGINIIENEIMVTGKENRIVELKNFDRNILQKWKGRIPEGNIIFLLEDGFVAVIGTQAEKAASVLKNHGYKGGGKKGKYILKFIGNDKLPSLPEEIFSELKFIRS